VTGRSAASENAAEMLCFADRALLRFRHLLAPTDDIPQTTSAVQANASRPRRRLFVSFIYPPSDCPPNSGSFLFKYARRIF